MSFPGRKAVVVALCVAGVLVVGCGGTVIDSGKAEDALQQNLQRSLDRKVSSVDCPSDQDVDPGATFTCTVRYSGGEQATATLKVLNDDADVSLIDFKGDK